jgi:small redox-active disulfide protein 2
MKKIQILGTGCPNCDRLAENAQTAAAELDGFEVEKITDVKEIMRMGVMLTPALAVDGEVKSAGKVLSSEEIRELLA